MGAVIAGLAARLKTFWPMLAGMVCARVALIAACYGSYAATDDGIFTDGAMLVTCALFTAVLLVIARSRRVLSDTAVQWILIASVTVAAASSMALSVLDDTDPALGGTAFALSVVSTLALSLCMFYWLRCLRGTDEVTAALFVFGVFIVSEAIVYLLSFLPPRAQNIIGAVLVVAQLALLGPAALRDGLAAERLHRRARTFFTFARSSMQDWRFLVACTVGIGLLGFVDGFLRGYPDGLPIPFTPATRAAYTLAAIAVCALFAALVVRRRERVMTVGIFIAMEALAAGSLILFGAFPFHWEIGAVLVNTLNVVICAYCWYVVIAFTSFGQRDPYFYALGGWVICFGSRSVARMLLLFVYPLTGNDLLITSLLGGLVLLSAQVVLVQFLLAEHREGATEAEAREAQVEGELQRAESETARTQQALAEAESALKAVTRDAAEHEAARVAEAVAAVQKAAFEAVTAAQAQRCVRCTEGCSPDHPVARPATSAAARTGAAGAADAPAGDNETGGAQRTVPDAAAEPRPIGASPLGPTGRTARSAPAASPDAPTGSEGIISDSLRGRVRAMGEQFLLSDREVDVLTYYALGYTQKKVAKELSITPATAHSHIKRIYGKCGMHSRQEILEYLASYGR
ncbi:helix-turn-helix transcriptional regulator [Adlercreutzia sp. R25]|uniref:Helix-turn-helix transcriptional regulator n=1 Tax=Adlercreutzia shanghongiae TaxID=3111773 RepID=A0ABU6IZM7_9ACTN|nr:MULTISPECIES: helix-turn-helix transcriptional regulator [unclassified Adlercreutzia]MEC4272767.1 helix-turn-helix transcriptional regulator [Adlercreutzia sp. R25]MEC4295115.1 helix-turn-helix transcriptional regulator [Adlercreutzia sp. R22]